MLCFNLVLLTTVLLVVPVPGKLRWTPIRISGLDTQADAVSLVSLFVRHMSRFVRRRTRGSESSELLFDHLWTFLCWANGLGFFWRARVASLTYWSLFFKFVLSYLLGLIVLPFLLGMFVNFVLVE